MRASTAFLVGVGTVGMAILGGLGGGLLVGNMMSPHPPKHTTEAARPVRPASPPPMPAASALPYAAATLAFVDPSIDGSALPVDQQADGRGASPPPGPTAMVAPNGQAKPADSAAAQATQEPRQVTPAKQAYAAEDAYAKARASDLRHAAGKRRAERLQRWADRHRRDQDQNADQQARDDRNEGGANYSYDYSDHRYRDDDRGHDDRAPRDYVDEAPRFTFPRLRLFGPDD